VGKKKEMSTQDKPELRYLHAPPQHGEKIKTNLITLWNDIFGCQNQSQVSFKNNGAVDAQRGIFTMLI
jgi:hypothetical protein